MFAILAAVCFFLVLIHVHVGDVDLTILGLLFLALALVFGGWPTNLFQRRQ